MYKSAISLAFLAITSLAATSASAFEIRFTDLGDKHRVTEQRTGTDEEIAASVELALQEPSVQYRHDLLYDETWVADVGTLLTRDLDNDGYYTGFSLSIDVDTHRANQTIYLFIETRDSDGNVSPLHRTADFIDVHDAWDDRVLDTVRSNQFSNLSRLPLESEDLDFEPSSPVVPVNDQELPTGSVRVVEHAGSASWMWLSGLALLVLRNRLPIRPRKITNNR